MIESRDDIYLEVTDLKQWLYCPRVVYYRFCLPKIRPVTYSMEAGDRSHEAVSEQEEHRSLRTYGLDEGEREFHVAVSSAKLRLSGRIDMVIRQPIEAYIVDFKLSEHEAKSNLKIQLCAYAMLLEESWQIPVRKGFIYHIEQRKAEAILITPQIRKTTEDTIATIFQFLLGERMPNPPTNLGKCVACEFRRFCNDVV